MKKRKIISIVIPAYNEYENIHELTKRLDKIIKENQGYLFEVIIIENASSDETFNLLIKQRKKFPWLKILQLSKNVGCDGAIVAGLSFAKGEAAIVLMADLQEDPKIIPTLIRKWEEGNDVVYGIVKSRGRISTYKKIGAKIYYKLISSLSGGLVLKDVSDFRLLDKKVYNVISEMPEHNKFFRGISAWAGFKQIGIDIRRDKRFAGKSKADLKTLFRVALNGIISFSYLPLRIGWFISLITLVLLLLFLTRGEYITSIILLLMFFTFIQLSILSEYMIRVIEETRGRPNFIVKNKMGF